MTEAEWHSCNHPDRMLEFLRGKSSDRKLRLFACACCRQVWHWLEAQESRQAVVVAEQYADGLATLEGLLNAYHEALHPAAHSDPAANAAWSAAAHPSDEEFIEWYAGSGIVPSTVEVALNASGNIWCQSDEGPEDWPFSRKSAHAIQSSLLRDVFSPLPWRPVTVEPAWMWWNDGLVEKLARAAYDFREVTDGSLEPARLVVLADAVEEAGCDNAELLAHLRSPGPHVRGCWALDLLLGKESDCDRG